jgi:hypothetical protein
MTLLLYDDEKYNGNRAVCLEILELASISFRSTALPESYIHWQQPAGGQKGMSSDQ